MALVAMSRILDWARENNCAAGAFSVGNMEMIIGAVKASEELSVPIILQIAEKRLKQSPLHLMAPMMISAAENAKTPVAVHLDHGITIECVKEALDYGFTSVMLDASLFSFKENIAKTKEVKNLAEKYGATVEAELGVVGGNEGDSKKHEILCTDPKDAKIFLDETGVDCLAVAIGNAHGNYPVLPQLRFDVLEEINKAVDKPLVLHGGTGITPDMFRKAISFGVRKINIATASFDALANGAKEYSLSKDKPDYFELSPFMSEAVYKNIKKHIEIFSCNSLTSETE